MRMCVLFGLMLMHVALLVTLHQPRVHLYYDGTAMRDMATVWSGLHWDGIGSDPKHFVPAALFCHVEGALQFLLMNAYAYTIGNVMPLDPTTLALPNLILGAVIVGVAYLLGAWIRDARFGLLFAAMFAFSPWYAGTCRLPWVFPILSVALQLLILHLLVRLIEDPKAIRLRWQAPLALALYLTSCVDWPSFGFSLLVLLVISGRVRPILRNPWLIAPALVMLGHAALTIGLYQMSIAPGKYQGSEYYKATVLMLPFTRVGSSAFSAARVSEYATALGPHLALAIAGFGLALARWRREAPSRERSFTRAMAIWLVLFAPPLFRSSTSLTYAYVIMVPLAYFGARCLASWRTAPIALAFVALTVAQWFTVIGSGTWCDAAQEDRRAPAVAAYLNDRHADLLAAGRVAFLPRNLAANALQYARGQCARVVMPSRLPETMTLTSVSHGPVLEFVRGYQERRDLAVDWLVLDSEQLTPRADPTGFLRALFADPRVRWVCGLRDIQGRTAWIGIVYPDGAPAGDPEVLAVEPWAERYLGHYDYLWFLSRNVRYIDHY